MVPVGLRAGGGQQQTLTGRRAGNLDLFKKSKMVIFHGQPKHEIRLLSHHMVTPNTFQFKFYWENSELKNNGNQWEFVLYVHTLHFRMDLAEYSKSYSTEKHSERRQKNSLMFKL